MLLNGKTILITGANGGLGRAMAKLASARGATLLLADIDAAQADAAVASLPYPSTATAYHADLADAAAI